MKILKSDIYTMVYVLYFIHPFVCKIITSIYRFLPLVRLITGNYLLISLFTTIRVYLLMTLTSLIFMTVFCQRFHSKSFFLFYVSFQILYDSKLHFLLHVYIPHLYVVGIFLCLLWLLQPTQTLPLCPSKPFPIFLSIKSVLLWNIVKLKTWCVYNK